MTRGSTLLELLVALGILGLVLALAVPPSVRARDRALVALQAQRLAAAHASTREAARLAGARADLTITATALQQRRWTPGGFATAWTRPGPAGDGVSLTGPATPMVFDSRGYSLGPGNRSYLLSRGRESTTVVISRLGRLRILP